MSVVNAARASAIAAICGALALGGCATHREDGDDVHVETIPDARTLELRVSGDSAELARFDAALRSKIQDVPFACAVASDDDDQVPCDDLKTHGARSVVYSFSSDFELASSSAAMTFIEINAAIEPQPGKRPVVLDLLIVTGRKASSAINSICQQKYGASCHAYPCPQFNPQCSKAVAGCTHC